MHVISAGWQAIPMLEQFTVSSASRRHVRHWSVQAMHALSAAPKPWTVGAVVAGAGADGCADAALPIDKVAHTRPARLIAFMACFLQAAGSERRAAGLPHGPAEGVS
jgi:hypothetical protein